MSYRKYIHRHHIGGDYGEKGIQHVRLWLTAEQIAIVEALAIEQLSIEEIYMAGVVALKDTAMERLWEKAREADEHRLRMEEVRNRPIGHGATGQTVVDDLMAKEAAAVKVNRHGGSEIFSIVETDDEMLDKIGLREPK